MTEPNGAGKADQADEPETGTEYTAGHEGQAAKDMAQVSGLFEDTQTDLGVLELARILKPINEAHMALRSARLERERNAVPEKGSLRKEDIEWMMAELEWSRPMVEKALMAAGGDVQKALLSCL